MKDTFLKSVLDQRLAGSAKKPTIPTYQFRGMENRLPSVGSGVGVAVAKEPQVYTGDKIIGVAQMHKSNAVPVFSAEDAIDIAKMRR